jgi:hypothetical protein
MATRRRSNFKEFPKLQYAGIKGTAPSDYFQGIERYSKILPWPDSLTAGSRRPKGRNMALLGVPPVIGSTIPFPEWWGAPPKNGRAKRVSLDSRRVVVARETRKFNGMSLPIISLPPQDAPRHIREHFNRPIKSWALAREVSIVRAKKARRFDRARFPLTTPSIGYTGTSCWLLSEIQRHMLEPTIDGGLTWQLWTADEVAGYLNERISRFLLETGMIRSRIDISQSSNSVPLPPDLIDIRRVAWDTGSAISELEQEGAFSLDHGSVGWETNTGTPSTYHEDPRSSNRIRLDSSPASSGTIKLHYVKNHTTISPSLCVPLPIPSLFAPYIKYGVMSDMLSKEGEANAPIRAKYCEQRWEEGIRLVEALYGGEALQPPQRGRRG